MLELELHVELLHIMIFNKHYKNNFFKPNYLLSNPDLQTCYSIFNNKILFTDYTVKTLELPDGDFIDVFMAGDEHSKVVILLHGLEGSFLSLYVQITARILRDNGFMVVIPEHRSCSGRINRLAEFYHAGETKDIKFVVKTLLRNKSAIYGVGFSLGGNMLLHYLSENNDNIQRAVVISTPFNLSECSKNLPYYYDQFFLQSVKRKLYEKIEKNISLPVVKNDIKNLRKLSDFDHEVIAPIYGFSSANDYYKKASSLYVLQDIKVPTLVINALDDPIVVPSCLPREKINQDYLDYCFPEKGGHCGFTINGWPWRPNLWTNNIILDYLTDA